MKVVLAFDSFKGSLSSLEVANSFSKGVKKIFPNANILSFSMADGGEGTVQSLVDGSKNGKLVEVKVKNPLMQEIKAEYGILEDKTAIIEMASASGLPLIAENERNPLKTTTFGTGQLIKDAIEKGVRNFIIGIGGSATNDAGIGMLNALGYDFLDQNDNKLEPIGQNLVKIAKVSSQNVIKELKDCNFTIACDVNNPLHGTNGAAYVFAPQKGANQDMVKELDLGLQSFAKVVKNYNNKDVASVEGAGAAGGLGFGFVAFLNTKLQKGIDIVTERLLLEDAIKDANMVITGEGRIDCQSMMGKVPTGVSLLAKKYNIPTIAIGGCVNEDIENIYDYGITSTFAIINKAMSLQEAMDKEKAELLVANTAENIFRLIAKLK